MNTWKSVICIAALLSFAASVADEKTPPAKSYVIGLSPYLDKEVKDPVYRQFIALVVEGLPVGSDLHVYDAWNLQTITELSIPNLAPFRSAKTRANQFAPQILKLRTFLGAEHPRPDGAALQSGGAVRLPQFLDFVRSALPERRGSEPLRILLLGSPLYFDPKEPSFSMNDGYFPSDGHLKVGRDQSVYGVADRTNTLAGFTVHYGYFGDPWLSGIHEERVSRFWHLFLKLQGAELATLSGDLATVFRNATLASRASSRFAAAELDRGEAKPEMLRVTRDVGSRDWITGDNVRFTQHAPSTMVGSMKIGIRWQGDWDLDLYATARPGSETLFFQHTRCPEGYYFKDHRSSPDREYEFIEFTAAVDIRQVEAMVNFYRGRARDGAPGEVRVEFDNQVYSGQFRIPATEGNRGKLNEEQQDYWVKLDLRKILRLGDRPVAAR